MGGVEYRQVHDRGEAQELEEDLNGVNACDIFPWPQLTMVWTSHVEFSNALVIAD